MFGHRRASHAGGRGRTAGRVRQGARSLARARSATSRRGISSVLAMLYLMLFSALALGFYAQANMASMTSHNYRNSHHALNAAESGLRFIRYHLSELEVPYQAPAQRIEEIYMQLANRLDGTANLGGGYIGYDGNQIHIPEDPKGYVPLYPGGPGFHVRIKIRNDRTLQVKVTGRHNSLAEGQGRAIEVTFGEDQIPSPMQEYGVSGRGQVTVGGNGIIRGVPDPSYGNLLITTTTNHALSMTGPSEVSGKVYLTNPMATTSVAAGCIVGGTSDPVARAANIIKLPGGPPEFPVINTDVFKPYVTGTYSVATGLNLRNIRIPANTGTVASPLLIASGATINGILYIETPNVVKFGGSCTIRGLIASQTPYVGDPTKNILNFAGQVTAYDASTLDASYGDIRKFTGSSIICPGFHVQFSGGYAAVSGTIASSQLTFSGKAGGNITGQLIGVSNQVLSVTGNAEVFLQKPATNQWPAGVYFRSKYVPQPDSYLEVSPEEPALPPPPPSPTV